MPNFTFLTHKPEYAIFAAACVEAENIFPVSPALCAAGCRKALELAVKWVYAADKMITMPYRDNLQSLIHERTFREAMGNDETWRKLPLVVKLGNIAVHTARSVGAAEALASLRALFEFVEWIDYCYGADYEERAFDEKLIPPSRNAAAEKRAAESEKLIAERDARIEELLAQIREMSALYTEKKDERRETRRFEPDDLSEFATRRIYIDVDMKEAGWKFSGAEADVAVEYPVEDMAGVPGQAGFADYVLFGKDGLPLAVVEAKRTSRDPNEGRRQAELYAENEHLVTRPGFLGVGFTMKGRRDLDVEVDIPGHFNVYNALAAAAVCTLFDVPDEAIRRGLARVKVKGRVEPVPVPGNYTLLIDYAHNAVSMESILTTLREYHPHRLICLFGAGGNRPRARRYEMGEASGRLADLSVVTEDNSRFEDVMDIIADIRTGLDKTDGEYIVIPNRTDAIRWCIENAQEGDIVVLAGKGHEDYQEIRGERHHYDEREVIAAILASGEKGEAACK